MAKRKLVSKTTQPAKSIPLTKEMQKLMQELQEIVSNPVV